ncbi:ferric reductase-like transmembrane domain-containing protein [Achromobacter sp. ACM03]|nr:ferric reductase-like transmembrane domain-containing protein [Achromobacter sp. ACM03]
MDTIMKPIGTGAAIGGFLRVLTLAWGLDAFILQPPATGAWYWVARQQGLYLTGVWSIGLMALIMLLALRPAWLERPLGGMDKIYRLHKWAGILAVSAGAAHWLLKLASGPLKSLADAGNRPARDVVLTLFESSRGLAKDMGEWSIYLLLAMLAITLWRRFPYRGWRLLHRAMPVLFLSLAFHTAALAPARYWSGPVGLLLIPLLAAGSYAALVALLGRVGSGRRAQGRIVSLAHQPGDILEVSCELDANWREHQAGQFAFVTFDRKEGAHPYTIASAPVAGEPRVTFQIKALGDYTRGLARTLRIGQPVAVEGPYGRFQLEPDAAATSQVWVAGGIGVTPFLAWLEALQEGQAPTPRVWLHYCVRDASADPFVPLLKERCAALDGVTLAIHSAHDGDTLTAGALAQGEVAAGRVADVWFCGPAGLADALRRGLRKLGAKPVRWHQEAFQMR